MEKEFHNHSIFTARVILGIIFLAASLGKIADPAGFAEIIKNYQILPEFIINETAVILPFLELILAIMLISGAFLKGSTLISFLILISFTASLIFNMARGLDVNCGCFTTSVDTLIKPNYIYYIIRDLIFIFISGFLFKEMFLKKP